MEIRYGTAKGLESPLRKSDEGWGTHGVANGVATRNENRQAWATRLLSMVVLYRVSSIVHPVGATCEMVIPCLT